MLYIYVILASISIPIINSFTDFLHSKNGWWQCPLYFCGILFALVAIHFGWVVLSVLLVDTNKSPDKASKYYRAIINATLPMFFKISGVKIHCEGLDKVPDDKRFLFVCNHIDNFDPIVILSVLPRAELGFIGKKEIYEKMPIVAKAMHKLHGLPIDRENNREAAKTIVKAVNVIKEDKASVGIFPEGYASLDGKLLPMRNGAFKIAYKAEVPIVVAVIDGTKPVRYNIFRRRTDVYFKVLEVISAEKLKEINSTELGDKVTEIMLAGIKKIETEKNN
jgi:1-acyl-sn-glycerol-3-phosphate acyltransferase